MIQRHVVALASVAVACGQLGWAQAPSPKAESAARMRKDLFYIASDELQGRGLATDGIKLAAEHISKNFADVGVKPAIKNAETGEMSYYQPFTFRTAARLQSEKSAVTITSGDGTITIKPGNTMTVVDAPRAPGLAAAAGISNVLPRPKMVTPTASKASSSSLAMGSAPPTLAMTTTLALMSKARS